MIELDLDEVKDPNLRVIIDSTNFMLREGRQDEVLSLMVSIVIGAVMASGTPEQDLKDYLLNCVTRCYDTLPESGDSIH